MRPHERIPLHAHSGLNDGGKIDANAMHAVVTSGGSGGSTSGSGGFDGIYDHLSTSETDTSKVAHPNGSGGVDWGIDATGSPWFNVKDYGALEDNATDCQTAVDAAITALNAAGGGVLYCPGHGVGYYSSGAFTTITVPCLILGDGAGTYSGSGTTVWGASTIIRCGSGTADLFYSTAQGGTVRGIAFENSAGTPTAGSAIHTAAAGERDKWNFEDLNILGFYVGLDVQVNSSTSVENCMIWNPVLYGIRVRNTVVTDAGGFGMRGGGVFGSCTAGIRIESSGGNSIIGAGIGAGVQYGIQLLAAASSSILFVQGTTIENYTGDAIHLDANGHFYEAIVILGCEFGQYGNGTGHAIYTTGVNEIVIDDYALRSDTGTPTAFSLNSGDKAFVGHGTAFGSWTILASSSFTNLQDGTGAIAAGVNITGTPSSGQVPVASSGTAAAWGPVPSGGAPGGSAGGDLGGTYPNPTVAGLSHVTAGGDLSGTMNAPTVAKVNGVAVTGTPSAGQVITATGSTAATWQTPSSGTATVDSDHAHIDDVLFSGDGAKTAFRLPVAPVDAYSVTAYVAGVQTEVTLSGTLLDLATFGSAPASATNNVRFDITALVF